MAISLRRPDGPLVDTKASLGGSENFSIEVSWEKSSYRIDVHALMLVCPSMEDKPKLISDDHVLSAFRAGLPLTGAVGTHTEGDMLPFHLPCGALYHTGNARLNKGASVDQIIKVSSLCIPDRINRLAFFITVSPSDGATVLEIKGLKLVIKNAKKETVYETGFSPTFIEFNVFQTGNFVLEDERWRYEEVNYGWVGSLKEVWSSFKNAPEPKKSPPIEQPVKTDRRQANDSPAPKKETISLDSMAKKFPDIPRDTLREARNVISEVVLASLSPQQCAAWGESAQSEYAKVVDASYALTSDKCIRDSVRHIGRVYILLSGISSSFEEKKRFWEKKEKPWEVLEKVRSEVDQLKENLRNALHPLNGIKNGLSGVAEQCGTLAHKIDILSVSGEYLSDLMQNDHRADVLMARSLSLAETAAQMTEANILRKSSVQMIETLIARIRDTILISLPSWMDSVAFFALKSTVTETDLYEAKQGITEILVQLK